MAHKISIIIIILQMDLVEDYDDLIDRHYANLHEYHRIEPLENTANNRLFHGTSITMGYSKPDIASISSILKSLLTNSLII